MKQMESINLFDLMEFVFIERWRQRRSICDWWKQLFFFPFLWWVMAAARGRGSAKGERTKEKTIDWFMSNKAEWNEDSNKPINNKLFFFLKEKSEVVDGVACCWLNEWSAPPIQLIELECFSLLLLSRSLLFLLSPSNEAKQAFIWLDERR